MTTATENKLNFACWKKYQLDGGTFINKHLDLMERGHHGVFSQHLFWAMEHADIYNQQRLYEAFKNEFTPHPRWRY